MMKRYELFDGLRGYFLVFMFLNHLTLAGGYLLVRVNHAELGFVQDAQGFIFLSGLLVGTVYARRFLREGPAAGTTALWRRAAELYAYTMGCIIAVLLLRQLLPGAPRLWDTWLGGLGDGGSAFRLAGAALLYQPTYLDILPQYIVYMLAAPPLVWLCLRGRWFAVAAGSALLWLAVQFGLHLPAADALDAFLARFDPDLSVRAPFNVLAWQVVFIFGMVIGVLMAQRQLPVGRFFHPHRTLAVKAAAAAIVFFMAMRLGFTFELVPERVMERFQVYENRPEFGPVFLVNFVALGYLVTWLLVAGPQSAQPSVRRLARFMTRLFSLPFLRLLGRHSLQVYAWHVVLVYLALWLDGREGPFGEATKTAVAFVGIALLAVPPLYREWRGERRVRAMAGAGSG